MTLKRKHEALVMSRAAGCVGGENAACFMSVSAEQLAQAVFSPPNKICLGFFFSLLFCYFSFNVPFFFNFNPGCFEPVYDICISWLDKSVLTPAVSLSPSELAVQKEKLMPPLTRVSLFQAHRLTLSNMAK